MNVNALWRAVTRHRLVASLTFLVVAGLVVVAALLPPDRYAATATFSATPESAANTSPQVLSFQISTLQALIESQQLRDVVAQKTGVNALRPGWTTISTNEPGTGVLSVLVSSTDPKVVAPVANAYLPALQAAAPTSGLTLASIDSADPPTAPASPARALILGSGLALAAILAVLAALLASLLARRRSLPEEIRQLGVRVLAELPEVDALRERLDDETPAEVLEHGDPAMLEAVITLRTNVEILGPLRGVRTVVVTSRGTGAGKTTVAAHLAWALGSAGRDVIAVEADLRRPALAGQLGLPKGASSAWSGALARPTALPELGLVAAEAIREFRVKRARGRDSHHPADITAAAVPQVLDRIAAAERLVVVDSPALLAAVEATVVVAAAKWVIIVVDARQRDLLEELDAAIAQVRETGAEVLGVVLNHTRVSRARRRALARAAAGTPARRRRRSSPTPAPTPVDGTHKDGDGSADEDEEGLVPGLPAAAASAVPTRAASRALDAGGLPLAD